MPKYTKFEELPVWKEAARLYNRVLDLLDSHAWVEAAQLGCQILEADDAIDEPRRLERQRPTRQCNDAAVIAAGCQRTQQFAAHHAIGTGDQGDTPGFCLHGREA